MAIPFREMILILALIFTIVPAEGQPPGILASSKGDVFVLQKVTFTPHPLYEGETIQAVITILNKRFDLVQNGTLSVLIRRGSGGIVTGFEPAVYPIEFVAPSVGTITEATKIVTLELESALPGEFVPGETYTVYATILPYDEDPVVVPDESETVIGNNSTFNTFAVVNPASTIPVPDSPPWMSMLVMLFVLGWLFTISRREN